MNDRLTAVLCVWNEEALLPACLDSLTGVVDRVVLADGRYAPYPGEGVASTDGTLAIFRAWAERTGTDYEIVAPELPWETEHLKRTALVGEHAGHDLGDMILVIDADERLVVRDLPRVRDLYGDYQLVVRGVDPTPGFQDACRLFMWRPGLVYRWHFGLFTPSGTAVLLSHDKLGPDVVEIEHHHYLRTAEREAADKEYEAWLVPHERALGAYGG